MNRAVFLDRDGVINELIFNQNSGEYEPPHRIDDIKIFKGVFESLKSLNINNYKLFIVSNQPDFAKGKTSLENLLAVKNEFENIFRLNNISFTDYYYCFHHPEGTVREYSIECKCRKPGTFFIEEAVKKYNVDRVRSWMIGDRESDIEFGNSAGLKSILIKNEFNVYKKSVTSYSTAADLKSAVDIILNK